MPTPATIPRTPHRAAAAVPVGGGSSDITNATQYPGGPYRLPPEITGVTAWVNITRAAGFAGQVVVRAVFLSAGSSGTYETAAEPVIDTAITVVAGRARQTVREGEYLLPAPPTDAKFTASPIPIAIPYGTPYVWIDAYEIGDTAHPSTVEILLTASGSIS